MIHPHRTASLMLGVALLLTPVSFSPPTSATYTVTSQSYRTLKTPSGEATFCCVTISIGGGGASGGGAVVSANACGTDLSGCVFGSVSGPSGSTGEVCVNTSDPNCAKKYRGCKTITIKLANGDTFTIDAPGTLLVATIDLGGVSSAPPGEGTFPIYVASVATVASGGGHAGTVGSLPNQGMVAVPFDGFVRVDLATVGDGPPATFLGTGGSSVYVPVKLGMGQVPVDWKACHSGALVTLRSSGEGFDGWTTSFKVQ